MLGLAARLRRQASRSRYFRSCVKRALEGVSRYATMGGMSSPSYHLIPDSVHLRWFASSWLRLSRQVIAHWSEQPRPKRLTASSVQRVNQLVQEGHSMSEAMSRAAEWEAAPEAVDFDWP